MILDSPKFSDEKKVLKILYLLDSFVESNTDDLLVEPAVVDLGHEDSAIAGLGATFAWNIGENVVVVLLLVAEALLEVHVEFLAVIWWSLLNNGVEHEFMKLSSYPVSVKLGLGSLSPGNLRWSLYETFSAPDLPDIGAKWDTIGEPTALGSSVVSRVSGVDAVWPLGWRFVFLN